MAAAATGITAAAAPDSAAVTASTATAAAAGAPPTGVLAVPDAAVAAVLAWLPLRERVAASRVCRAWVAPARALEGLDFSWVGSLVTVGVVDRTFGVAGLVDPAEYAVLDASPLARASFSAMQSHEGVLAECGGVPAAGSVAAAYLHGAAAAGVALRRLYAVASRAEAAALEAAWPCPRDAVAATAAWVPLPGFRRKLAGAVSGCRHPLRRLAAFDCYLDAAALAGVADILAPPSPGVMTTTGLQALDIGGVLRHRVDAHTGRLAPLLVGRFSGLADLRLTNCDLDVASLAALLSGLPALTVLHASGTVAPAGVAACSEWFRGGDSDSSGDCAWLFGATPAGCPALTHLELHGVGTNVLPWLVTAAVTRCPRLRVLRVGAPGARLDTCPYLPGLGALYGCLAPVSLPPAAAVEPVPESVAYGCGRGAYRGVGLGWVVHQRAAAASVLSFFDAALAAARTAALPTAAMAAWLAACAAARAAWLSGGDADVDDDEGVDDDDYSDGDYSDPPSLASLLFYAMHLRLATAAGRFSHLEVAGRCPLHATTLPALRSAASAATATITLSPLVAGADAYVTPHPWYGAVLHAPAAAWDCGGVVVGM